MPGAGRRVPGARYDRAVSVTLDELQAEAVRFRDERDWAQFHNAKELAINLCIEAAELLELTQWHPPQAIAARLDTPAGGEAFADELSDVLLTVLLLADDRGLDLAAAYRRKLEKNRAKYPVDKARGSAEKYDRL